MQLCQIVSVNSTFYVTVYMQQRKCLGSKKEFKTYSKGNKSMMPVFCYYFDIVFIKAVSKLEMLLKNKFKRLVS